MHSIYELIALGDQNEHDLKHDSEHEKLYSLPTIYDADSDLNKRWYVYFSFRDPEIGKRKRINNFNGKANRYKTKEVHYSILSLYN